MQRGKRKGAAKRAAGGKKQRVPRIKRHPRREGGPDGEYVLGGNGTEGRGLQQNTRREY